MKRTTEELMQLLRSHPAPEAFLAETGDSLVSESPAKFLNRMLRERQLKKSQVIRNAGIDRVYGYQLFSGEKENPSRDRLLCLGLAMRLNTDELQQLLRLAQRPLLYPRFRRDSLILLSVEKHATAMECSALLESCGELPLEV